MAEGASDFSLSTVFLCVCALGPSGVSYLLLQSIIPWATGWLRSVHLEHHRRGKRELGKAQTGA